MKGSGCTHHSQSYWDQRFKNSEPHRPKVAELSRQSHDCDDCWFCQQTDSMRWAAVFG